MRCAALLVALVVLLPIAAATAQQPVGHAPQNGTDLLEFCSKAVSVLDSPETPDSDVLRFDKVFWCLGYVEGLREPLTLARLQMNKGVHNGPLGPFGLCVPEEASPGQLARVFVKWLRDHPESLHEPVVAIWVMVLASAFPCDVPRVSENIGATVPKLTSPAQAKGNWQDAIVAKLTSDQAGTVAVIVPMGGGLYGASGPVTHSFYWIKTDKITYIIPNYSNGVFIQRWLVLTIGGQTKISIDGRNMHIVDDDGKDRTVRIVQKIKND